MGTRIGYVEMINNWTESIGCRCLNFLKSKLGFMPLSADRITLGQVFSNVTCGVEPTEVTACYSMPKLLAHWATENQINYLNRWLRLWLDSDNGNIWKQEEMPVHQLINIIHGLFPQI